MPKIKGKRKDEAGGISEVTSDKLQAWRQEGFVPAYMQAVVEVPSRSTPMAHSPKMFLSPRRVTNFGRASSPRIDIAPTITCPRRRSRAAMVRKVMAEAQTRYEETGSLPQPLI